LELTVFIEAVDPDIVGLGQHMGDMRDRNKDSEDRTVGLD